MTGENKNEFYVEIWWISREGTAGPCPGPLSSSHKRFIGNIVFYKIQYVWSSLFLITEMTIFSLKCSHLLFSLKVLKPAVLHYHCLRCALCDYFINVPHLSFIEWQFEKIFGRNLFLSVYISIPYEVFKVCLSVTKGSVLAVSLAQQSIMFNINTPVDQKWSLVVLEMATRVPRVIACVTGSWRAQHWTG